jgi:hypothetical protein
MAPREKAMISFEEWKEWQVTLPEGDPSRRLLTYIEYERHLERVRIARMCKCGTCQCCLDAQRKPHGTPTG